MLSKKERKEDIIRLVKKLDLSPSMYKDATEKYKNLGEFLSESDMHVDIYPQGSFATGTVVRPYKDSKDSDYDVDCICLLHMNKNNTSPEEVKNFIGDKIKSNEMYSKKLLPEDSRCWTLEYANKNGIGFNLDVVPSLPADYELISKIISAGVREDFANVAISITNKDNNKYNWCDSNPKGYAEWFKEINKPFLEYNRLQRRQMLFESNREIFNSVEEIPEYVERSSLQMVIQILKRHRDIYFTKRRKEGYKPISAIITTMVGQISRSAQHNMDVLELLEYVVNEIIIYSNLLRKNQKEFSLLYESKSILSKKEDRWTILNPVNPLDNLTDSWNDDSDKAKCFFEWVNQIKIDFIDSLVLDDSKFINLLENSLGSQFVKSNVDMKKYGVLPVTSSILNTPKPYCKK